MSFFTPEDTFSYIPGLPTGKLIEFGIYHADVMSRLIKGAIDRNNPFEEVYGFDSFEGLPAETEGEWLNPDWPKGAFSIKDTYGLSSVEDCISFCKQRVWDYVGEDQTPKLNFIPGFFDKSLTAKLGKNLQESCSYLHVDVDLFSSTMECMDWTLKYNVMKPGCLLRMDDWLYNGQFAGNNKAFYKMTKKYKVEWATLADNVFIYLGKSI